MSRKIRQKVRQAIRERRAMRREFRTAILPKLPQMLPVFPANKSLSFWDKLKLRLTGASV